MTDLEQKIQRYADVYYQGNEQIDDAEYDALIDQLRKESPKSALLPENQGIAGSDLKGIDKKYKLDITMGTLAKCNTDEQFEEWWSKHPHDDIIVESKIDGAGCYLHYENGEFKYARSRGDSEYGTDLTDKLYEIVVKPQCQNEKYHQYDRNDFPTGREDLKYMIWNKDHTSSYIPVKTGIIDIRGEVVMLRSTFNECFKDKGFKNPRSTVSGALGQKDLNKEILDKCVFIAYDVFDSEGRFDRTEEEKLNFLKTNCFNIPEYKYLKVISFNLEKYAEVAKKDEEKNFKTIKDWKDSIDTNKAEIPCDGIVIKQNKVDKEDLMRHTPLNNVAYKPNLQIAITKVTDIDWTLKGRYLAPTAIVEPVELCGTTVKRASLSNINKMIESGIEIGSTVEIAKAGLIIPKILKVLS